AGRHRARLREANSSRRLPDAPSRRTGRVHVEGDGPCGQARRDEGGARPRGRGADHQRKRHGAAHPGGRDLANRPADAGRHRHAPYDRGPWSGGDRSCGRHRRRRRQRVSSVGPWLLVFGAAVIVVEGTISAVWSVKLARQGRALAAMLERERGLVQGDVARLHDTLEETRRLWEPWRRALRWLRHPFVAALLASFWRRVAG